MIIEMNNKRVSTENEDFWIAPDATVIGDVQMAKDASIWFHCTIRGDNESIILGEGTNIQDNSVIHTDPGFGCTIGKFVTVGHMVMLHGCEIGDGTLIGIGSVILNGAKIGKNCIIGAKALITEGMVVPDGSMVLGMPGKIKKELSAEEQLIPSLNAHHYIANYKRYKAALGNGNDS
jgi:carbonic anhydrase/acetyltransferase-like protein (isoleucine patch superfamily)